MLAFEEPSQLVLGFLPRVVSHSILGVEVPLLVHHTVDHPQPCHLLLLIDVPQLVNVVILVEDDPQATGVSKPQIPLLHLQFQGRVSVEAETVLQEEHEREEILRLRDGLEQTVGEEFQLLVSGVVFLLDVLSFLFTATDDCDEALFLEDEHESPNQVPLHVVPQQHHVPTPEDVEALRLAILPLAVEVLPM